MMWLGPAWTEDAVVEDVDTIRVHGALDVGAGARLAAAVVRLAEDGRQAFVVDLSTVETVEPAALIPLVRTAAQLVPEGVRVSVVFDSRLTVFTVPGLESCFDVAVTLDDAVSRLTRSDGDSTRHGSRAAAEIRDKDGPIRRTGPLPARRRPPLRRVAPDRRRDRARQPS